MKVIKNSFSIGEELVAIISYKNTYTYITYMYME